MVCVLLRAKALGKTANDGVCACKGKLAQWGKKKKKLSGQTPPYLIVFSLAKALVVGTWVSVAVLAAAVALLSLGLYATWFKRLTATVDASRALATGDAVRLVPGRLGGADSTGSTLSSDPEAAPEATASLEDSDGSDA